MNKSTSVNLTIAATKEDPRLWVEGRTINFKRNGKQLEIDFKSDGAANEFLVTLLCSAGFIDGK